MMERNIKMLFVVIIFAMVAAVSLTACQKSSKTDENVTEKDISGKSYVWEKEGFGGDFVITLYDDGTFEYYEGNLSSYIGSGSWTLEKGIVTLEEDESGYGFSFRFAVRAGELVYLSEGSDTFIYTKVSEGDHFVPSDKHGLFLEG